MVFNSLHFAAFLPIVATLYFLLPHRLRWGWLLMASCYFYMAFIPYYILILVLTIAVDYVAGIVIAGSTGRRRRMLLLVSIVANVGILGFFKYTGFLLQNIRAVSHWFGQGWAIPAHSIVLPIGLSFHTFQSMSYTIEVYRGRQAPERNLGRFALYVLFFPQLVAGPIERPQNLLHQFTEKHAFDYERIRRGLQLVMWGLIQKMVIADRLAPIVDRVYQHPEQHGGLSLIFGTVCFAIQILCDFAGYSDMALGIAEILGFHLMVNFRRPYLARSVAEFWRRWHISLSSWFRDYVYIPLGGSRTTKSRHKVNVLFVFALSGLWHGADWKFVIWGALNGVFVLCGGLMWDRLADKVQTQSKWMTSAVTVSRQVWTFVLVCITWVFFRAGSMSDSFVVLRNSFSIGLADFLATVGRAPAVGALLLITFMILIEVNREKRDLRAIISGKPVWFRWGLYLSSLTVLLLLGEFNARDFIYFQF